MRPNHRFASDERAIEGMPIRLVIALVVGVASLGIMMNMLTGIGDIGSTEVTVEITDGGVIEADSTDTVTMEVVDEGGDAVTGATVIVSAGSGQMDGVATLETGPDDNEVTFDSNQHDVDLPQGQDTGTLELEIVPPSNSDYEDERSNPDVVVVQA